MLEHLPGALQIAAESGNVVPDCRGTADPIGTYNGETLHQIALTGFHVWFSGIDLWNISAVPGDTDSYLWQRDDVGILGTYYAQDPSSGNVIASWA